MKTTDNMFEDWNRSDIEETGETTHNGKVVCPFCFKEDMDIQDLRTYTNRWTCPHCGKEFPIGVDVIFRITSSLPKENDFPGNTSEVQENSNTAKKGAGRE